MRKIRSFVLSALIVTAIGFAACAATNDRAKPLIEDARKALDRGEPNSATTRLQKALEIDPDNGEAHFLLALALMKTGDLTDVEMHLHAAEDAGYAPEEVAAALADAYVKLGKYGKILDEIPEGDRRKDIEARIRTARGYAQLNLRQMNEAELAFKQGIARGETGLAQTRIVTGDLAGANELLEQAVANDPKLVDAWVLLGRVRNLRKDPVGARAAFDSAVSLAPDSIVAMLGRATLLIDTDDRQAAADVAAILDQAPDNWRANLLDAIIKTRHQQWREAEAALMTIPAPEQLPQALLMLARVNLAQNQIGQADANITHYMAIVPNDPAGLAVKAEVLVQRGKPAGAIDLLKQGLAKAPENPALLSLLSDAYTKNHQNKEAAETLDRLSAIAPHDADTRLQLAEQRIAVGRINEALDDIAIARAADPLSSRATTVAIEALLASNQLDRATEAAEELRRQSPDSPLPETYLGLIAVRHDGLAAARSHFEKALALQPTFATAAINLSQTYRAERRFDEARAVLDRVLQLDPKSEAVLMARVDLEAADHKPDAVVAFLERARAADPQATTPRFQLVRVYLERKDAAAAARVALELSTVAPRDARAVTALAEAQLANNDRQSAIANFQRVVEMTANSPESLLRLAGVLTIGGDSRGGYAAMRKALDSNPGELRVQQAMLEYAVKTDNVGASEDLVRDLLVRRPDEPGLYGLLGALYEADGRYERAAAAYQAGLTKAENADLVRGLGRARTHGLTPDEGLATLTAWLDKHADDNETRLLFAGLLQEVKQYDRSIAEYERLLAGDPKNPLLLNNLAWLYSVKSDPRATGLAEQAHTLLPDSPGIADTLGWILLHAGKTDRGLELLRQANAAAPTASMRYHLAVALSKAGQKADAVRVLTDLLASGEKFDELTAALELKAELGS